MRLLKATVFILCLAFSLQTRAFWIKVDPIFANNTHGVITKKALLEYFYFPNSDFLIRQLWGENHIFHKNKFQFSRSRDIAKFNEDIDGGSTASDASYHCDDERIDECGRIVREAKDYLIHKLREYATNAKSGKMATEQDFSALRERFGRSLHTLQDFYAHSNWVERSLYGKTGTIRMNDAFTDTYDADYINYDNIRVNTEIFTTSKDPVGLSSGHTCITGPAWNDNETPRYNDIYLKDLITGFYFERAEIYDASEYCNIPGLINGNNEECQLSNSIEKLGYANKQLIFVKGASVLKPVDNSHNGPYFDASSHKEKCIHSSSPERENLWDFSKPTFVGIAKDNPRTFHHDAAVNVAVRATKEYAEHIISKVVELSGERIYTDWVILRFLGHDVEINAPVYQGGVDEIITITEKQNKTISVLTSFKDEETTQKNLKFSFEIIEGSDVVSINQSGAKVTIIGKEVKVDGQATILVTVTDEDNLISTKSFNVIIKAETLILNKVESKSESKEFIPDDEFLLYGYGFVDDDEGNTVALGHTEDSEFMVDYYLLITNIFISDTDVASIKIPPKVRRGLYELKAKIYNNSWSNSISLMVENDIIIDDITGLQWQNTKEVADKVWVTDEMSKQGLYNITEGDTSSTYCSNLALGGYSDWRLPSIEEIIKKSNELNSRNKTRWTYVSSSSYGSYVYVSSRPGSSCSLWCSGAKYNYTHKTFSQKVRCVRG